MKTVAVQSRSDSGPARAQQKAESRSDSLAPWFVQSVSRPDGGVIQRKASCACGGGCPDCQSQPTIQTKLSISEPGDIYEQEADRVAEQVMRMPDPAVTRSSIDSTPANAVSIQRKCQGCEDEEALQRKPNSPHSATRSSGLDPVAATLRQGGQPLDVNTRSFFESRFGTDFSAVRIHTDTQAAESARSVNARAYTVGSNVVFNTGQYVPQSDSGKRLLAHELTHVVQQGAVLRSKSTGAPGLQLSRLTTPCVQRETDADIENGTGVGPAITAGTMTTDPAVHGQTIVADNCFGREGCRVRFRFTKAYRGDYNYVGGGGLAVRGVYVRIDAHANPECGNCPEQPMIQVLRFTTRNAAGNLVAADPQDSGRRDRAGWNDPNARSRGWGVDVPVSNPTVPYVTSQWTSHPGTAARSAVLRDTPGHWATDRNAGMEFESCLMCRGAGGPATSLGCVRWGFFIDSAGTVSFQPAIPVAYCGVTQPLNDATLRFGRIPGNTPARADFRLQPPAPEP